MEQFRDCSIGAQVTWYGFTGIWVAQFLFVDGRAVIVYGAAVAESEWRLSVKTKTINSYSIIIRKNNKYLLKI